MIEIENIDDLKNYKRYDKCHYKCIDCGSDVTQMVQTARRSNLRCIKCLRKQKGIEKYGSEEEWKKHLKETKQKGDQTLIDKTGDPHIRHTLYVQGCLKKYGVDNTSKLQKHKDFMTNHNPSCRPEVRQKISEAMKQRALDNLQKNPKLPADLANEEIDNLWRNRGPFPYLNQDLKDTSDIGLIQHFHKSLYKASRKGKPSPLEAWDNEVLYKKCIKNRLKYVGKCTPEVILQGFNVSKIAPKVSVFKPQLAEELIAKYCHTDIIFDPFSGFSGRLLGAANLGKAYYGQDINEDHVKESIAIMNYKHIDNSLIIVQDILTDTIHDFSNMTLFTCPPYGGKEHWNENNDEIEKTCDEWIDICLEKYKCKEYIFVVDQTDKYKDKVVGSLKNKSHFGENYEYIIYMTN